MLDHVTRRSVAMIAMASVLAVSRVFVVDAVRFRTSIPRFFKISGFSMAPTLMGQTEILRCPNCAHQSRFPIDQAAGESTGCHCPQCGNELESTDEIADADQVESNDHSQSIKRGDLVAITGTDPNRLEQNVVKRVVGIPGDTIDTSGARITINGIQVHDMPWVQSNTQPTVAVYHETGQGKSRWTTENDWLVYHHFNPYRGLMPSPVLDDYPVNVKLSRRLQPVTRLIVRRIPEAGAELHPEIVIWNPDDEASLRAPVSKSSPVAIRITNSQIDPTKIEIRRAVVYRLRRGNDRSRYPIELSEEEYFVLGDNVPISVDSRDWGPVHRESILCTVTPVEHGSG